MVQITPVSVTDEKAQEVFEDRDEDYSDISESDSEFSDDMDDEIADETITDRIVALKDIVPPQYRPVIANAFSKTQGALEWSLKAAWVITTSVLFVGAPLALLTALDQEPPQDAYRSAEEVMSAGQEKK
ncbi:mitochondrial import receptor subunit tom-22 [Dipodascopsis uninucleata]